jgi:hypothetical protein
MGKAKNEDRSSRRKAKARGEPTKELVPLGGIGGTERVDEEPLAIDDDDWMQRERRSTRAGPLSR